jgi:adenosylcobyric acid synthase
MSAPALMILGTASHAGKSLLTAAFGRIFSDEGYRVAPFKAQNMSLNSAATPDGREIGRAQALQAEACRVPAKAEMNPVLIKPSTDTSAQVVVLGRVWREVTAADYHQGLVEELFPIVVASYRALAEEYDLILIEGAGSPAEINLQAHDIVNMRMAHAANASCLLVGDIDRGGVFASLLGTVELLDAADRALIRGFIVNKFRGDRALLDPGIEMIAGRIRLPCAGVVPYLHQLGLDEEDSVALEDRRTVSRIWQHDQNGSAARALRISVVAYPHMANFTDFDALAEEPSIALAYVDRPEDIRAADLLVLPGSKQTLDDLQWLRQRGFSPAILDFRGRAGIFGICGGMQMLGSSIEDPAGVENNGAPRAMPGLARLGIRTILAPGKVTRLVQGNLRAGTLFAQPVDTHFEGYEIHLGETIYAENTAPFAEIKRQGESGSRPDGAASELGFVFGTYVHGLFSGDAFRHSFIVAMRARCGLLPATYYAPVGAEREGRIDRWAGHVRSSVDMDLVRSCISA